MEFTAEDNAAIASIDLNTLKPALNTAQFNALAKFIQVVTTCEDLNNGERAKQ